MKSPTDKPAVEGSYAFNRSPMSRAARLIEEGNARAAKAETAAIAKRVAEKPRPFLLNKSALLLNVAGGHKMPPNAVAISDFKRAGLEGVTPAPGKMAASKAVAKPKPMTSRERVATLEPTARAALVASLERANAAVAKLNAIVAKSVFGKESAATPKPTPKAAAPVRLGAWGRMKALRAARL
jgi:hypothetical protein